MREGVARLMKPWRKSSMIAFVLAVIVAIPLSFCNMFGHEGGHGLLVVPAIALNGEIPQIGIEGENPFKNFPPAALLFILSFPLGVVADAIVCYLSYRNANDYQNPAYVKEVLLLVLFLAFCLMTLKSTLSNLLTGADFSFVWKALGVPFPGNDALGYLIKATAFLVFPIYLGLRRGFGLPQTLAIGIGTFIGASLAGVWFLPLMYDWLMTHFFWLFIIGLPVFVVEVAILWGLLKHRQPQPLAVGGQ